MKRPPRSECRDLLERLSAYLDGDLDAVQCRSIEEHCRGCPDCARLVEGLRRTIGICQQAANVPLPKAVRDRARARVRDLLDRQARSRR